MASNNSNDRSLSSPNFHHHSSLSDDLSSSNTTTTVSTSQLRHSLPSISASGSFQRTMESARYFRDNLNNVIREIQPLVENARSVQSNISFASLLNRPSSSSDSNVILRQHSAPAETVTTNNSVIIDVEQSNNTNNEIIDNQNNPNDNNEDTTGESDENQISNDENNERQQTIREAQQIVQVILKYIPFLFILLAKSIYDYHEGIFIILILFITFTNANSTLIRETTKRHQRSIPRLTIVLLYITACLLFLHFKFYYESNKFNEVFNLALIRTYKFNLTGWSLIWIVTLTDFILKLITIVIKTLFTMLPGKIVAFQKRGKIYLFIEALSQTYRSMATIQPWLYYLLESYSGPEKIVAVFLSAFYILAKSPDLMSKLKLLKNASFKLLQNVTIGSSPSKEQIQTAGDHCPICHDQYESPVLLECRHIFCENCVSTWFDREQTCPLCRAKIVDDPSWRDGSTTHFIQIF